MWTQQLFTQNADRHDHRCHKNSLDHNRSLVCTRILEISDRLQTTELIQREKITLPRSYHRESSLAHGSRHCDIPNLMPCTVPPPQHPARPRSLIIARVNWKKFSRGFSERTFSRNRIFANFASNTVFAHIYANFIKDTVVASNRTQHQKVYIQKRGVALRFDWIRLAGNRAELCDAVRSSKRASFIHSFEEVPEKKRNVLS